MLKLIGDPVQKSEHPEHKITFIQKVIKGETWLVMAHSAVELEDEWSSLYFTSGSQNNLFLMPPFEPNVLLNLVQTNNVLNQCIEAMEVNIDGTGHEFVPVDEGKDIDKKEEKIAKAFFDEPYPNISMVTIRRKLRRQMESVGYGFIEVLRNMAEDVVGLRSVETAHIRMVKLDKPIQVKKKVQRDGTEVELLIWERERRFAQTVALKQQVYYREFGTTRHINRDTGDWEEEGKKIPPEKRGSELLCLGINPDVTTPYWLPRWINQLPSVIGSRAAEEQNLQFLDAGGLPPAIVFIQGGTLIKDTSDQLRMYLSGLNKNKNRAVVVEVQSSSGSLDAAGKVDVKVERFGSAQSQDAMYTQYDESTKEHIRIGFRLPPLFLGYASDYNFATAQVSYMVAEAQVFLPERAEFDEMINKTIMKELKLKTLLFKSKPITLKDVETQLKALELSAALATRESYLKEINTVSSMALELAEVPAQGVGPDNVPLKNTPTADELDSGKLPASMTEVKPGVKPEPKETIEEMGKKEEVKSMARAKAKAMYTFKERKAAGDLLALTQDYAMYQGLMPTLAQKQELTAERAEEINAEVESLHPEDLRAFNSLLAMVVFGSDDADLSSIVAASR
jgi:PBSX family phage portal protein